MFGSLQAGSLVWVGVSQAKELAKRMGQGKVSLHASYWYLNSLRSLTNTAIRLVKIDILQKPVQAYCISHHANRQQALFKERSSSFWLTHWLPNEIARDIPLNSQAIFDFSEPARALKINHMRSNHRHKIRFQDFVYLKFNIWRAKKLKNINKKNSIWCVEFLRKQEIIFFLCRATKAEKIEDAKMS